MDLKESYRKNKEDIKGIFLKAYPDFIFRGKKSLETGEIPVFVFHSVIPSEFEEQLKYLAYNNYKTVDAEDLYNILIGKRKLETKTIALTFDDGLSSLWTIVYPLLRKYGFVGISFLIPSLIKDDEKYYPNLENLWQGKTSAQTIFKRKKISPLCSWNEIKIMHGSGVIDFQSHSFYHSSVYVSDKIIDFVNPSLQSSPFMNGLTNHIMRGDKEVLLDSFEWGYPIYEWKPNLEADRRYIENEKVARACVEFVKRNGGVKFFENLGWKKKLRKKWNHERALNEKRKKFQPLEERLDDIRKDLTESKERIEQALDKDVFHLCYPWYKASDFTVSLSKEAGYKSNFWGEKENSAINKVGDDPYYIKRINENYIFSLPGKGRKSLLRILSYKALTTLKK
jgi:peptidoglycan/xylan/chitin deacetylase (PgdA/CDA1 family)